MDDNSANPNFQPNTNENFATNAKEENNETALDQGITENEYQQGQGEVIEKNVQLEGKEVTRTSNEITNMEKIMGELVQLVPLIQTMKIGMTVKIAKSDEKKFHIECTEVLNDKIMIENDERAGGIFQQDQDINLHSTINTEHFSETKDAECNLALPSMKIENTREDETFQQDQDKKIFSTVNDEPFNESPSLSVTESNMELSYDKIKDTSEGDMLIQDQYINIHSTGNTEPLAEMKAAEAKMEHCDKFGNAINENNFQQDEDMKIPLPFNDDSFDKTKDTELNIELPCDNIVIKIEEDGSQLDQGMDSYSAFKIEYFNEKKGAESNMELSNGEIENTIEEDIFQQDPDMKMFSTVNVEPFDDPKVTDVPNRQLPYDKIDNTVQEDILQHDQAMNINSTFNTETLDETNGAESYREPSDTIEDTREGNILEQEQDVAEQFDETKAIESNIEALNTKSTSDIDTDKFNISEEDQGMVNRDTINMEKLEENTIPEPSIDTVDYNTAVETETIEEAILQHNQEKDNQVSVKNGNQDADVVYNVTFKPIQRDGKILSESSIKEENDESLVIKPDTSEGINLPQKKRSAIVRYLKHSPTRNAIRSLKPSDWKKESCMPGDCEIRKNETEKSMAIEENNFTEGQDAKATEKFKIFNKIKGWFKNRSEDEESEEGDIDEELNPTHYFAEDGSVKTVDLSKKSRKKN
ncbi:hypothetical protein JTE90_022306 [Oedothorax gibbosus]|uniref:Uncharacterized protein n=1 Tax=Oedothorax gibbosus TaxID=931172 RepID=A0AAV6VY65_9ARAC|nr:hypothetical protein JTE90_022306 [Oedothorax gibbosus]